MPASMIADARAKALDSSARGVIMTVGDGGGGGGGDMDFASCAL